MKQLKKAPVFTPEDYGKFQNAFDSFDSDRDGLVSVELLGKLVGAVGYNPRPDEVADMIEDVSAPVFDFKSFLYLIARHRRSSNPKQDLIEAFRFFDKDGSGTVTTTVVRRLLSSLKDPFTADEIAEFLGHERNFVDARTDSVNYDDFVKLILEVY
jgi:calmodulin